MAPSQPRVFHTLKTRIRPGYHTTSQPSGPFINVVGIGMDSAAPASSDSFFQRQSHRMALIGGIGLRRQQPTSPSTQPRQSPSVVTLMNAPAQHLGQWSKKLKNIATRQDPYSCGATSGTNELPADASSSPSVNEVSINQAEVENGKGAPELIPSASRDPADDVRRRASVDEGSGQKEGEGVATPKPHSSTMVGVTSNTGEGESHATPRTPNKLQRTLRSVHAVTPRYKGRGSKPKKPTQTAGVPQPPISGPGADEEKAHEQGEGFVISEPRSPATERRARPRTPNKLQRTLRSIRDATPRYKGGDSKQKKLAQTMSVPHLPTSSSMGNELSHSSVIQREENLPRTPPYAEGDQRDLKVTTTRDTEQTAGESEEIEKLRYQIAELQKRCEAQSRDLENSNQFLNTADKSSDSDIIQALQRLNAEVQQNTTYMADCLSEDLEFDDDRTDVTEEQNLAVQRASGHIGSILVNALGTVTPEDIPMLLQVAFQAYLVSMFSQTASSWTFEPAYNAFIDGIYQRLRRVEAQAISGRWRVLSRIHIVHSWISEPGSLVKGIIAGLSDILLAASCTALESDIISMITSKFEERISLLVGYAGRLNKLFDDVISSDFEVLAVRPGEVFEARNMEDTDDDQVMIQEGVVLCATHLGLMKRVPEGTLWERGRKQKVTVLKAKVLLESFLSTED